jgi:hypothetical protein
VQHTQGILDRDWFGEHVAVTVVSTDFSIAHFARARKSTWALMTSDCRKLRAAAQLREKARFTMRARKEDGTLHHRPHSGHHPGVEHLHHLGIVHRLIKRP